MNSQNNLILVGSSSGNDGNKTIPSNGSNDVWLVELDQNLTILNQKVYGGTSTETINNRNR
jgi:hypothetical protein